MDGHTCIREAKQIPKSRYQLLFKPKQISNRHKTDFEIKPINSHNNTKQQRRTNFSLQHTTPRHQDTGGKKELKAVTIYNYK